MPNFHIIDLTTNEPITADGEPMVLQDGARAADKRSRRLGKEG